jgi:hypothetical protein
LLTASRCGVKLEIIWEITKQILGTPDELILSCSPVSPRGLRSALAILCLISALSYVLKYEHSLLSEMFTNSISSWSKW